MANTVKGLGRVPLRRGLIIGGVAAAVAACTGTEDPSRAGFLDGVGNLASGTYDRRIDEREQELTQTQATSSALQGELAQSERDLAALEAEEAQLVARLNTLERENQESRRRLAELRQRQDVDQQRLAALQSQAEDVAVARDRFASSRIDPELAAEVAELEREQAEISQAIDDILLAAGPIE